jgi:hypothetical protein
MCKIGKNVLGSIGLVYFGQFFETNRISRNFWTTIFCGKSYVLILTTTKNGLEYTLSDFFKNSSGHPGNKLQSNNLYRLLHNAVYDLGHGYAHKSKKLQGLNNVILLHM